MSALVIEKVDVLERRVDARVRVLDPALIRTSAVPQLAERARTLLPGLARHSCENLDEKDFLREMRDTETPHLLEHVVAELMALAGSPRTLKGETVWDFARDGQGVFVVSMEFDDDLVAVGAFREAIGVVEWLFDHGGETPPDIAGVTARLRSLRE